MAYEAKCRCAECEETRWPESTDGRCLYHSYNNDRDEATAKKIWAEARRRGENGECNFSRWHFPSCSGIPGFSGMTFGAKAVFHRARFAGGASFERAAFHRLGADFIGAHFGGESDFRNAHIREGDFRGAVFLKSADFSNAKFEGCVRFDGATFRKRSFVRFDHAEFRGAAVFPNLTFENHASFQVVTFHNVVHFSPQSTFGAGAFFSNAIFREQSNFTGASFDGDADFQDATFAMHASFEDAVFLRKADFGGAKAERRVLFDLPSSQLRWGWPLFVRMPFLREDEGASALRLAKISAQNAGDYRMAGEYHFFEQCAAEHGRRKKCECRPWRREFWLRETNPIWCWGEFVLARGLFGYGERPLRPLLAGALVIFLCGCLFWLSDGIAGDNGGSFLRSVYFSVVTFTTLGYGDFRPAAHMRWLAGIEAFTGAALMALFVVALARRYTR